MAFIFSSFIPRFSREGKCLRVANETKRDTIDLTFIVFFRIEIEENKKRREKEILRAKTRYLLFNKVRVLFNFKQDLVYSECVCARTAASRFKRT